MCKMISQRLSLFTILQTASVMLDTLSLAAFIDVRLATDMAG